MSIKKQMFQLLLYFAPSRALECQRCTCCFRCQHLGHRASSGPTRLEHALRRPNRRRQFGAASPIPWPRCWCCLVRLQLLVGCWSGVAYLPHLPCLRFATQAMDGGRATGGVDILIACGGQFWFSLLDCFGLNSSADDHLINDASFEDWWNRADEIVDGQLQRHQLSLS